MARTLFQLLNLTIHFYIVIVLARVILSWVNPDPYHPVIRFLYRATDPVLNRINRVVTLQFGGFDFSPVLLVIALSFLQRLLRWLLL